MKKGAKQNLYVKTYAFPGKWMSDEELDKLRGQLIELGRRCLGEVLSYGVYLPSRAPYKNRIITVVYSKLTHKPIAFAAMVVWPIKWLGRKKTQTVVHLGLVLVDPEYRGKMIMYWIYHRPLSRYFLKRFLRPFWITSATMTPVIFGSIADNFSRVFPHYLPEKSGTPDSKQLQIAETFVKEHGFEIGIWEGAWLDTEEFILRGSAFGASKELIHDYEHSAKYRIEACNEFCRERLNYERGDEFIQVARVDLRAVMSSFWWFWKKIVKWLNLSR